jgi:hypothetical protein
MRIRNSWDLHAPMSREDIADRILGRFYRSPREAYATSSGTIIANWQRGEHRTPSRTIMYVFMKAATGEADEYRVLGYVDADNGCRAAFLSYLAQLDEGDVSDAWDRVIRGEFRPFPQ